MSDLTNEELLFKNRFSTNEGYVRSSISKYMVFKKAIKDNKSKQEIKLLYNQFINDLASVDLSLANFEMSSIALDNEDVLYRMDKKAIDEKSQHYDKLIVQNNKQIEIELKKNENKQQYDKIKEEINTYKPSSVSIKEIEQLEKDINALEAGKLAQKQCSLLVKDKLNALIEHIGEYRSLVNSIENNPDEALNNFMEINPDFDFEQVQLNLQKEKKAVNKALKIEKIVTKHDAISDGEILEDSPIVEKKELPNDKHQSRSNKTTDADKRDSKSSCSSPRRNKENIKSTLSSPRSKRNSNYEDGELVSDTPPLKHHKQ